MKIIGNGVDIVENKRIEKAIKNEKFIKRIYTRHEIQESKKVRDRTNFFAKRFAAKEAFVKSMGTGFTKDINFKDIAIKKRISGKPEIVINKKVKKILTNKFKIKKYKIFLSLADERKYSIAYVILNKINGN